MACEEWRGKVDLYLDGELAPVEASALNVHLRGCAACAAQTLERVQLKRAVHFAGKHYDPSPQLRSKIAKGIAAKSRPGFGWRWRLAAVAAVILLVASGALYSQFGRENARRQRVYSELADLHVATLASSTPVDVLSSDRHTVKPWFQGKVPFTFNLPELQGSVFSLLGGRVTYLQQNPGAHLIYQVRKHEVSVFIFPERAGATLPSGRGNELTFSLETWTQNGLRYVVLGDASRDDIEALSRLIRDAG
jgi:anti-sigma factor RsiW